MSGKTIAIRAARFPDDAAQVLAIWREYVASPSVSLSFQNNAAEFADLPGKYAAPAGCVLLAERAGEVLGCVAIRPVDAAICEMKKLYVRPAARGTGAGLALVQRVIEQARAAGYREMRLDVLAEFAQAQAMYARLGFIDAPPVAENPVPGTRFLGLQL